MPFPFPFPLTPVWKCYPPILPTSPSVCSLRAACRLACSIGYLPSPQRCTRYGEKAPREHPWRTGLPSRCRCRVGHVASDRGRQWQG